jgi:hypothetical protein
MNMTKSYNAGAAVRKAAVSTKNTVVSGAKGTGAAVKGFWAGLTGKTLVQRDSVASPYIVTSRKS